ncbi:glycosyltransferase family 2 protein [Fredinandcohnia humi]
MTLLKEVLFLTNFLIFFYVVIVDTFYLVLLILSLKQLRLYLQRKKYNKYEYEEISTSYLTPPVSILVPAYNEEKTIIKSMISFLNIQYPEYEVIIINDGSNDQTLDKLIEHFKLVRTNQPYRKQLHTEEIKDIYYSIQFPQLKVIDKINGGKADALNAGLNLSSYPYFCAVDADSVLEHDALIKTMKPFMEGIDDVIVCGGIVRIAKGCKISNGRVTEVGLPRNLIALHQVIEYLRSFLMGRLGFSAINNLLIVSGAFGVFRKKEVLYINGYKTDTIGEDMELVIRLQRYLYDEKKSSKVLFLPDPVCWTEAPSSLKDLYKQRSRWHLGLLQCLWEHKRAIFNPTYKFMGIFALPYFLFVELLGPTIELVGFILLLVGLYFDFVSIPFAILFFIFTLLFGIFLSLSAVFMEEYSLRRYPKIKDLFILTLCSFVENFWYRQLNAVWRTWAFFRAIKRDFSWGDIKRSGFEYHKPKEKPE